MPYVSELGGSLGGSLLDGVPNGKNGAWKYPLQSSSLLESGSRMSQLGGSPERISLGRLHMTVEELARVVMSHHCCRAQEPNETQFQDECGRRRCNVSVVYRRTNGGDSEEEKEIQIQEEEGKKEEVQSVRLAGITFSATTSCTLAGRFE